VLAVLAPLATGADVIALFDEVTDRTVTPVGVSFPAVTPEETRTIFAKDFGVNPARPVLPFVRPFVMTSASQFRADGPPHLTSYTFAKDLKEVKAYGSAAQPAPVRQRWTQHGRECALDGHDLGRTSRCRARMLRIKVLP